MPNSNMDDLVRDEQERTPPPREIPLNDEYYRELEKVRKAIAQRKAVATQEAQEVYEKLKEIYDEYPSIRNKRGSSLRLRIGDKPYYRSLYGHGNYENGVLRQLGADSFLSESINRSDRDSRKVTKHAANLREAVRQIPYIEFINSNNTYMVFMADSFRHGITYSEINDTTPMLPGSSPRVMLTFSEFATSKSTDYQRTEIYEKFKKIFAEHIAKQDSTITSKILGRLGISGFCLAAGLLGLPHTAEAENNAPSLLVLSHAYNTQVQNIILEAKSTASSKPAPSAEQPQPHPSTSLASLDGS